MRWLVDGMNVIGSRPDGWWRDRDGAARRLVASLQVLAGAGEGEITVVFEDHQVAELAPGGHGGVKVLYARRRGPDAADDRIVEEVAADAEPGSLTVVTSDRGLIHRVKDLGASVVGPQALWSRLAPPVTPSRRPSAPGPG